VVNYKALLDSEVLAFVDRMNALYTDKAAGLPMPERRALYKRMCRAFEVDRPAGVRVRTFSLATAYGALPVRTYWQAAATAVLPTVLYFHGGGFTLGDLDSHGDFCAELCALTRYSVVSVAYRLAPEHRHPAAFNDAIAAFEWLAGTAGGPIVLAGDSAGGNLAASIAFHVRHHAKPPAGLVLVYPLLGGDRTQGSYLHHAHAPLLSTQDVADCLASLTGGPYDSQDIRCMPLAATDYTDLPETFIATAECDPLSSDGKVFCERLLAAGGKAVCFNEPGLVHGYLRARHVSARAMQAFRRVVDSVVLIGNQAMLESATEWKSSRLDLRR